MTLKQAMKELESAGTERNRTVYEKHGVKGAMFGVSYADLKRIAKAIRTDQKLASQLWATGNHDARILATMIGDAENVDEKTLKTWAKDIDNYVVTDAFSAFVARTPHGGALADAWTKQKGEWIGQAGWNVVAHVAIHDEHRADDWFAAKLATIEKTLAKSRNRVKHAMNGAIIAIGMRNKDLEKAAFATAKNVGKVDVDHGETGCVTPDATDYIKRAKARKTGR